MRGVCFNLFVLTGLPVGPVGRRCLWLCVFPDAVSCRRHIRVGSVAEHGAGIVLPVTVDVS